MHLLLSQLKLVDHGAMREVYMAEQVLNQVGYLVPMFMDDSPFSSTTKDAIVCG